MKKLPPFDKYFYYKQAVQAPLEDIEFFNKTYKSFYKKKPYVFREDFCGTFYIAYHWVKQNSKNKAIAIDKDPAPLNYGKKKHESKLQPEQKKRLRVLNKDILEPRLPKADIISVSNFSYFILKEQALMLKYFKNVRKALNSSGLFIIDAVGGPECEEVMEEETKHKGFSYFWDQDFFDPITRTAHFYIHFKRKGEKKKRLRQFSYEWRLWTLPELKDLLKMAGFSKVFIYWEESDKKGEGTGVFKKARQGDLCDTWVAYLVALP